MDEKRQSYNKPCAEKKRHAKKSSIKVGDCVLIRQERRHKLTSNYNSEPYTVTYKNKCEITATSKDGQTVRRNVSHRERILRSTTSGDGNVSDDPEDYILPSRNSNSGPPENQTREVDDQLIAPPRRSERWRRKPDRYGQNILS